jgi:hypothetical protein
VNRKVINVTTLLAGLLLLAFGAAIFFLRYAQTDVKRAKSELAYLNQQQYPDTISPEEVVALINIKAPFILINADDPQLQIPTSPGPTRLIYYTTSPSIRSALKLVAEDRRSKPTGFTDAIKLNSQRLTGTPLEWQRLQLPLVNNPLPTRPSLISPQELAEVIKEGVDLQIVDLRPIMPGSHEDTLFPKAHRWMPHEVLNNSTKLSKEKWTVLIGFNNEPTQLIAWELFKKGFLLMTVLDGGYQAWIKTTNR